MNRAIFFLLLLVTMSGCVGDQLVTRRFQSMVWDTSPPKDLIKLNVISFDPPSTVEPAKPAILSLSDRGQASYINAVKDSADMKKSADLLQLLAKSFPEKEFEGMIDRTTIKKSIVLSVMKTDALQFADGDPITEADRIAKLELRLKRHDEDTWYRLQSWDRLGTVYGTIDLGKIMRESSGSFNAKLSPTLAGDFVGTGEIGGGMSTKINEELTLKARPIEVSGTLTPAEGVIIQQGGMGRDLEGNVSVELSVKLNGSNVNLVELGQLVKEDGTFKKPADVTLKVIPTRIPYLHNEGAKVELDVSADYLFRHVKKGKESVIEGDDVVTLYKGKATSEKPLILLGEADYQLRCEYLLVKDNEGEPVHIESNKRRYNLAFARSDDWDELKVWLKSFNKTQFPLRIGSGTNSWTLTYKGHDLKQNDVSKLGAYPESRKQK